MKPIDAMLQRAIRLTSRNRASRRAKDKQLASPRSGRSTRVCSVCGRVTPTYRLITPPGRSQMCTTCRDQELKGEVV